MSVTDQNPHHDFDHHKSKPEQELYEEYAGIRGCPATRSEQYGGFWVLARHADVEPALRDWETYSSAEGVLHPRLDGAPIQVALEQDPPDHTVFRKLYTDLLSRSNVSEAEPYIEETSRRLVAEFAARGGGDFVPEISEKLPVQVIAHLLGLSEQTSDRIREVTEEVWERASFGVEAAIPLAGLLIGEIEERRADPRSDFLSTLLDAEVDGRAITDAELMNFLIGGVIAGHETTLHASANLMLDLASDQDLQDRLRDDRSLVPAAVEESLRLRAPVQNFVRTLTRDVEADDGRTMKAGEKAMILYGAANRDPERYPDPDQFDLDREFSRHLSFGWGIHRCPGSFLAQTELRILCNEMLQHKISLAGEPQLSAPTSGGSFLGLRSLPLRIT